MAPDTLGSSVKPSGISTARVARAGTPLGVKPTASLASSPSHPRLTPRPRRYGLPPDKESNSSLSDNDQPDSEAETERLHISPQKVRPKMLVQHSNSSTTTTIAVDMSPSKQVIVPDSKLPDESPQSPTPRGTAKKRKREENGSPSVRAVSEDPEERPAGGLPPKKKVHASKQLARPSDAAETLEGTATQPNGGVESADDMKPNGDNAPLEAIVEDVGTAENEQVPAALPDTPQGEVEDDQAEEAPRIPADEEAGEVHHEDEGMDISTGISQMHSDSSRRSRTCAV